MNVLLVTYHPLKEINGGTVMYKSLVRNISDYNLYWVPTGSTDDELPHEVLQCCSGVLNLKSFLFRKNIKRVSRFFPCSILYLILVYFYYVPLSACKIIRYVKKTRPDVVWFELARHNYFLAYLL